MAEAHRRSSRQNQVLNCVRERGEASRVELARLIRLDSKTVSHLVDDLVRQSLIEPSGYRDSRAGRRQELLRIHGAHSNYIGIDLGANHIIGILTDLQAAALDRIFFEIRPGLPVELILAQMKSIARRLLSSDKATAPVHSVGICVPGFVLPDKGVSIVAENIPGWRDIRVKEIFEAELERPVYVEDASRAFGLAERWLGHGKQARDFLLLDLGYGIGMAVFIGGELYAGSGYKSGEIGHVLVKPDGPPCACGRRGCLEAVASGQSIAREAARGIREGRSELLAGLTHGQAETVKAQDVAIAASMGDEFACGLLREAGRHIGTALANAVNLLNPSLVILGGGLVGAGQPLLDSIAESLRVNTMMGIIDDLQVRVSGLGVDGSALGSALLAMEHVFSP
jgi:predicted NBD/HSP70 family sugar kinase